MEYVKGRTLAQMLEGGRLDAAAILPIARQVAEALADAHEHGVVHRDVKPGNVMVERARPREGARLRPRPLRPARPRGLRHLERQPRRPRRGDRGDARLHVAGAGPWPRGGRTERRLLARGAPLRDAGRPPPLRREKCRRARRGDPHRRPATARPPRGLSPPASSSSSRGCSRRTRPGAPPACARSCAISTLFSAGNALAPAPGRDHTVAVTGFANVTGRPEDAWLGTGLAETVSAGLAASARPRGRVAREDPRGPPGDGALRRTRTTLLSPCAWDARWGPTAS